MESLHVEAWIELVAARVGKNELVKFACTLWAVWYARNALVFRNSVLCAEGIVRMACMHMDDYEARRIIMPSKLQRLAMIHGGHLNLGW